MSDTDSSYLTEYNSYVDTDEDSEFTASSSEIVFDSHIENIIEITELDEMYHNDAYSLVDYPAVDQYYIATYKYTQSGMFIFAKSVSPDTFFKYPYAMIVRYFHWFSMVWIPPNPSVEIIQIRKIGDQAICVLKTHWIRLIQRTWRRVYKEQQRIIAERKRIQTMRSVELGIYQVVPFPDLVSMLSPLQVCTFTPSKEKNNTLLVI